MVFLSRDLSADATVAQMRSDCQTVSALAADVTMRTITRSLRLRGGSISDYSDIDEKRIFKIFDIFFYIFVYILIWKIFCQEMFIYRYVISLSIINVLCKFCFETWHRSGTLSRHFLLSPISSYRSLQSRNCVSRAATMMTSDAQGRPDE